ncbi:MAG: aminomethyl-transferring glycine dehydrogenase subunit GcvPB [Deltaproteobacteria bacterium]|nr:aminomethyl-transferring glycine dehydrogenase subunit GcvPB [Deltaproteobacteria bacterium]MBI4224672.1 aminomethyl-transferring glycine dehydrogenase subunit GcvPB [Deltaproteobacteria bacterium]
MMILEEPLLCEQTVPGRQGYSLPEPGANLPPKEFLRQAAAKLPEVSEVDVVRHFVRLSQQNYSKDVGLFPLGSCTMKYNPKTTDAAAALTNFAQAHPMISEEEVQGNLELIYELQNYLAEIGGMDAVTCWPAAGSHGELTGMMMIRAFHASKGNPRKKVIIPDSAHGTNPASAAICRYEVVTVKSNQDGILNPADVKAVMDEETAALMITNPNTLGLFEKNIQEICEIVHKQGGLVYCDGANLNALLGIVQLGKEGVDVLHFNLHKTFSTPHGGGGPGAGPVGVKKKLEPFLPTPLIIKENGRFNLEMARPQSIGRMKAYFGNFGMLVRAYAYIRELGPAGLRRIAEMAVLNANYIRKGLEKTYHLPYPSPSLHECVFSDKLQKETGVKTLDIAKRLMDYGFHPPTIYFPLIVHGALMIEPTESEPKASLDQFIAAMKAIAKECEETPELVQTAPHKTFRGRLDEVKAARELKLRY